MTRFWAPLVLLGIISGCTGSGTGNRPTDPFFGRTRVEPPTTGWAQGQRSPDPYYSNANTRPAAGRYGATGASSGPPTGAISPPSVTLPPGANAASPSATQPPGGWQGPTGVQTPAVARPATGSPAPAVNIGSPGSSSTTSPLPGAAFNGAGDRIEIPLAARQNADSPLTMASRKLNPGSLGPQSETGRPPANAAAAAPSAAASVASLAETNPRYGSNAATNGLSGRERIVRVLEPRPEGASSRTPSTTGGFGSGLSSPTATTRQPIDIMDLPAAGTADPYRGSQSSGAGQVQLVSATEPASDSSAGTPRGRSNSSASAR